MKLVTCKICGAAIDSDQVEKHHAWHVGLHNLTRRL